MPKDSMLDVAFVDKAAFWVNLAHIATVSLTVMLSIVVVVLSNHRVALRDQSVRRLQ